MDCKCGSGYYCRKHKRYKLKPRDVKLIERAIIYKVTKQCGQLVIKKGLD